MADWEITITKYSTPPSYTFSFSKSSPVSLLIVTTNVDTLEEVIERLKKIIKQRGGLTLERVTKETGTSGAGLLEVTQAQVGGGNPLDC